jgi:biopolymer transport protein ExbD
MTITTVNKLDKIEGRGYEPVADCCVTSGNRGSHSMARNQFRHAAWYLPVLLLSTLWASPLAAQASEPTTAPPAQTTPPAPARPAHPTHRAVTLDDRVKAFAKALDLNESQQAAVKKILEQRQVEMLRIRQDTSIEGSDRIGKLRALQDQTVQRIRSVLNDDQKKKYDPLAVRNREPAPDQKSVEDWLKATTPK